MRSVPKLALVLATTAILSLPAAARDDQPFTGDGLVVLGTFEEVDGGYFVTFTITGSATPIGSYTGSGSYFLNEAETTFSDGAVTYTTQNGDLLYLTFEGTVGPGGTIAGTLTIVGGTGLYDGAVGSADLTGKVISGTTVSVQFDGDIDF